MKFIKDLLPYIDQDRFRIELNKSKKLTTLLEIMIINDDISENEACALLLGSSDKKQAFKQIKLRLRKRLIEFILINGANFQNVDKYSQQYRVLMNSTAVIKYLMMNNARSQAVMIAESVIYGAMRNEFTDVTLLLAKELTMYYGVISFDSKKYKKYANMIEMYKELYLKEINANLFYYEVRKIADASVSAKDTKTIERCKKFVDRVKTYPQEGIVSYELLLKVNLVVVNYLEFTRQYESMLELCEKMERELRTRKISILAGIYIFNLYRIRVLIQLQQYQKAEEIIENYLKIMTNGTVNWFSIELFSILNSLHAGHYSKAIESFDEVHSHKNYFKQSESMIEIWLIHEAHIEFVRRILNKNIVPQFRLSKFLNEIPLFSKDKRGLNIAILTIQFLFLLQQRKYSQIIDRAEALKQYCYRYLRKDDTFRSHCFIRMLLMIPKADFNRIRTERYAEPYLTKLRSVPLRISEQTIEVEVIPYEDLWEMTLELLN